MNSRSTIFPEVAARMSRRFTLVSVAIGLAALLACSDRTTGPSSTTLSATGASADRIGHASTPTAPFVTGLQRGRGSAVGPDGALYVTESAVGRISRVDPKNGTVTTFASGFPLSPLGAGGVVDVAFVKRTAYALVTIVGANFVSPLPGEATSVGIYRVDGPTSLTLVTDIGKYSAANLPPPNFPIALKTGVQFALEPFRGGFLVSDGHHNRVLRVTRDGEISTLLQVGNVVPTGLTVRDNAIYMTETGPIPHAAADGKVLTFSSRSPTATEIARGEPLMVDVEFGRGRALFALSQGIGSGGPPATPAVPNTGKFLRVNKDGTFTTIKDGLDRPTSLKFIGNTAYVVTLAGEVWKFENVGGKSFEEEDENDDR
jgi:sugar lactone lactonase YvrE